MVARTCKLTAGKLRQGHYEFEASLGCIVKVCQREERKEGKGKGKRGGDRTGKAGGGGNPNTREAEVGGRL